MSSGSQRFYISQDLDAASKWTSSDLRTTIFNSNVLNLLLSKSNRLQIIKLMKTLIFLPALTLGFSCSNPENDTVKINKDQLVEDLISMSNDYQQAYISRDWDTASKWTSSDLGTTIFNSNGSKLATQDEQQATNSGRGWDFGKFEMSNHQVSLSSDANTAVITFEADGLINFEDGDQDVSYATRASQTWVKHDGQWLVMHSHWSPRTNSQGVPQQE
jgi:ketosteroid isomerase-like protein